MKKILFSFLFCFTLLHASLEDKSAIVYYGNKISYPMVGIHDYIIIQPDNIDTYRHGFELYKNKMYAYISIGEAQKNSKEFKNIKPSWIVAKNKAWSSVVLDLTNKQYTDYLFSLAQKYKKRGCPLKTASIKTNYNNLLSKSSFIGNNKKC